MRQGHDNDLAERRGTAFYDCMDGTELKKHMSDDICHPLAELFRAFQTGGDCKVQIERLQNRVVEIMTDE